ncbi:hypothetical protein [Kitasatospora cathayae]|uniref:Uncharacterized protein n=1 Tax=Kitasatospora cathayae TaxID=3004092 RepID=A0ABY7Q9U0_9ACTN|nr:hypothetical protein [Kitasatospora sp. HUAS 3-15]WBP89522.1 hypothetical protein O1G21_29225 [Kitasatospora sp. HUAS 3-15]
MAYSNGDGQQPTQPTPEPRVVERGPGRSYWFTPEPAPQPPAEPSR